jgi:hypothetical protein
MWAAVLNAERGVSNVVIPHSPHKPFGTGGSRHSATRVMTMWAALLNGYHLTRHPMNACLHMVQGTGLDVRLVSYGPPTAAVAHLVKEFE